MAGLMNLLIISYFSKPGKVGSMRIRYWEESFTKLGIPVTVWTAEEYPKKNYIFIQDNHKSLISYVIKDHGVNWKKSLRNYIINNTLDAYTHIIITGGPFMHFGIIPLLREKTSAKIILDYRDPFSNNPRFENSWFKRKVKLYYENQFNKNADTILVVNSYMKGKIKEKNVKVIENGYDSQYFKGAKIYKNVNKDKLVAICAGKLYLSPENFIQVVTKRTDIVFNYFGSNHREIKAYSSKIISKPAIPYSKVIKKILESDIGIIFTKGNAFESTTKIYDYIGGNIKILIITRGEKNTGTLHEITKNYPNIVWAYDNPKDINQAIDFLKNMPFMEFDSSAFTRAFSFDKLLRLLKEDDLKS